MFCLCYTAAEKMFFHVCSKVQSQILNSLPLDVFESMLRLNRVVLTSCSSLVDYVSVSYKPISVLHHLMPTLIYISLKNWSRLPLIVPLHSVLSKYFQRFAFHYCPRTVRDSESYLNELFSSGDVQLDDPLHH